MVAASSTSIALVASACGGGGSTQNPGSNQGTTGGAITIRGCTPQNPLVPGNTAEVCGGNVLDAVMAKLVRYNPDTAAPQLDIAQSITTKDNQTYTVKLKPYKFQDGTEVKAKNFVDAWNYAAYAPNGQENGYFFAPLQGYADLQPPDAAAKQKPKTNKMTGLKVVDDHTFTIKTTSPVSNLLVRLGYIAFAPLPDSFFKDPKAFANKPIGAGPFKFDSKSTTEMDLSKFDGYSGQFKPNVNKVTFRIYQDLSAAYNDVVANNLDFTDTIPPDQLVGEAYKSDLQGRNSQTPSGTIQTVTFSPTDPSLKDPNIRKAISMAVDRDLINKQIFNGTRPPMDGWVSPVADGFKDGACGEFCKYNPTKAKQMLQQGGGWKGGTLTLAINGDGTHKPWADAACNSIKNTLGIDCLTKVIPTLATMLPQMTKGDIKGLLRTGWQMDYPSIEDFLTPIFAKGAGSNYSFYNNPKFEAKLMAAAAAKTPDAANKLYQEAEDMLVIQFPSMPMWSYAVTVGWSNKVTNVKITPFGTVDLTAIKTAG
jgi:oligopeptide transport system substrate-binding protein